MDVIVGLKGFILILLNIQGFLWWRRTKNSQFSVGIKVLIILSTIIVSLNRKIHARVQIISEFCYRFTQKRIRALHIQMLIAQWLVFGTMTVLTAARSTRHKHKGIHTGLLIFNGWVHVAFFIIFILALVPNPNHGAFCESHRVYPNIMIASDSLFLALYFVNLVLYKFNYLREWDIIDDDSKLTPGEKLQNRHVKKAKALFM